MAGNRNGKTYSAAYEIAMHATGDYPDWWAGRRFDHPVHIWTGSTTGETSRDIIQKALLGNTLSDIKGWKMGTGAIPGDALVKLTTRQSGVKDVLESIRVRHRSGGQSDISLKTYELGREKWQGVSVHAIWMDEEPPEDIYVEALTRLGDTGGIMLVTFTPLNGRTKVVERFLNKEPGDKEKHVTNMTINDAEHLTEEMKAKMIASWPAYQRKTRAYGIPMAGEGVVFPIDEEELKCRPFEIPRHFAQIWGVDFGIDHYAAGVLIAHDRHADIVYVTDAYKKTNELPLYHAAKLNAGNRNWIPVAWPHDGINRGKDGKKVKDLYRDAGANMLRLSARYDDEKGGAMDTEPVLLDILQRMQTGRFKVFDHLHPWFDEFRNYHRKDGKIIRANDDIMSATNYAMMMLRKARVNIIPVSVPIPTQPVVGRLWANP